MATTRRVVVIGSGNVGAAVAARLGPREGCQVTVLDQAPAGLDQAPAGRLPGWTGHAPGFVGRLGDADILTEPARESVRVYRALEWRGEAGFEQVGGWGSPRAPRPRSG
ncbi:hypothetical protein ABZS86_22365 [Streptomyces sp. NPDC005355]|uniref:hypothetical protein n=1 Tax=Streptomyces sp. NPDC005355 TaxID=3157038 RepID=UPI0033BB2BB9